MNQQSSSNKEPPKQQPTPNKLSEQQHQQVQELRQALATLAMDTNILASVLLLCSAICWVQPERAPSIVFFLIGMGLLVIDPTTTLTTATSVTQPMMARHITMAITNSLNDFVSADNQQQTDHFLQALGDTISRALQSKAVTESVKDYMITTLTDRDLHSAIMDTMTTSMIQVSNNPQLLEASLIVVKKAMIGALSNDVFVQEMTTSIVGAIVTASQKDELTKSMMGVITQAVSKALEDERFVGELRNAMKDTLQDGDIYRAGARGMLSAAFGKSNNNKSKSSGSITDGGGSSSSTTTTTITSGKEKN